MEYVIFCQGTSDSGGFLHPIDHPDFECSTTPLLSNAGRFNLLAAYNQVKSNGPGWEAFYTILGVVI